MEVDMLEQNIFTRVKQEAQSPIEVQFKTLTQQTFTLQIAPRATVAAVKSHLSSAVGLAEGSFWLMFETQELCDDNLLQDYNIQDGAVVHVVLRVAQVKSVEVKMLSGKVIKMQFNEEMRVGSLKEHLHKVSNIHVQHQRLICEGRELQDQERIVDLCPGCDELKAFLVSRPNSDERHSAISKVKVESGVFPLIPGTDALPAIPDISEMDSEDVSSMFANSPRTHSFSNVSTRSSSPDSLLIPVHEETMDWRKVTDRVKRRQLRNRLAAERSRNRKANYVQDLEMRLSMALSKNETMERQMSDLTAQVARLQLQVKAQEEQGIMRVEDVAWASSQTIVPSVDIVGTPVMGSVSAA